MPGGGWEEDAHPRDERGRFGGGGGGSAKSAKAWAANKVGAPKPKLDPVKVEQATKAKEAIDQLARHVKTGVLKGTVGGHVQTAKTFLEKHKAELPHTLNEIKAVAPPDAKVKGRTKELVSALGKLNTKTKYGSVDKLQDGTGVRVIAKNANDVKSTVDKLKEKFKVVHEDNYIDAPKGAYRSHHLIIETKSGLQKELQIRTDRQNVHAEWAHTVYKPATPLQREAVKKAAREIEAYSKAVSDHYHAKDTGRGGTKMPKAPDIVVKHFGALPDR